jgi:hypothetical protein
MSTRTELLEALEAFLREASKVRKARALAPLETKLTPLVAAHFRNQAALFLAKFAALKGTIAEADTPPDDDWESLWGDVADATSPDLVDTLQQYIQLALPLGAKAISDDLGMALDFKLDNPRAVTYLKAHGAELVTKIDETTRDELRTLISDMTATGETYDAIAAAIQDTFDGFADGRPQLHIESRAHMVAVTEMGNAYAAGNAAVANDLSDAGLTIEKSWMTMGDDRVSDECAANEAEGWIPNDQAFSSGDDQPLAHPGCRCDAAYRTVAEKEDA